MFSLLVGEDGRVLDARELSDNHPPECSDSATAAARQAVFTPALDVEGRPVQGRASISVVFEEGLP
jgi:hypothetical protein